MNDYERKVTDLVENLHKNRVEKDGVYFHDLLFTTIETDIALRVAMVVFYEKAITRFLTDILLGEYKVSEDCVSDLCQSLVSHIKTWVEGQLAGTNSYAGFTDFNDEAIETHKQNSIVTLTFVIAPPDRLRVDSRLLLRNPTTQDYDFKEFNTIVHVDFD